MPRRKTTSNEPEKLRPYLIHGVDLSYSDHSKEAVGECPFCNRIKKFSVNIETGKFRCFVCGEQGNISEFIKALYSESLHATTENDYKTLAKRRNFKNHETVQKWGAVKSIINDSWLVPGFNADRELKTLYIWGNKLFPTPTLGHYIQGMWLEDNSEKVYVTEGFWDGVAWSELVDDTVVSLPGSSVFFADWLKVFEGKDVYILLDNDHPKKSSATGKMVPPAGYEGSKRITGCLGKIPKSINYLKWGEEGYDKSIPTKTDIGDYLAGKHLNKKVSRSKLLQELIKKISPVDTEWIESGSIALASKETGDIVPIPCSSWTQLIDSWQFEGFQWIEELDIGLSVMLACSTSTQTVDDQLWVKVISPPSSGKSVLCEALSVSKKYVLPKSTIRGFHSGYGGSEEDHSLAAQVGGMTLITKDGDTLIQSPNLPQILSEGRDLYDTVSRTSYRTGKNHDYTGKRFTWILAGTKSLREIDQSELGVRFLDCVIIEDIDLKLERLISRTKAKGVISNINKKPKEGDTQSNYPEDMVNAMALTGGYLEYLRNNSKKLYSELRENIKSLPPKKQASIESTILDFALYVAFSRARPADFAEDKAEREMSARLTGQLTKLALSLAVVMNKKIIDEEVLKRTCKVSCDTGRGTTADIIKCISDSGEEGMTEKDIAKKTKQSQKFTQNLLRFLVNIKAIYWDEVKHGRMMVRKYHLSSTMKRLYATVLRYSYDN